VRAVSYSRVIHIQKWEVPTTDPRRKIDEVSEQGDEWAERNGSI